MSGAALIGWHLLATCSRCAVTLHGRVGKRCAGCRTRGGKGTGSAERRQDARDVARTSGHGKVARKRVSSTFALVSGEGRADLGSAAASTATGAGRWRSARAAALASALLGAPVRFTRPGDATAPAATATGGHEPYRAMDDRMPATREDLHEAMRRVAVRDLCVALAAIGRERWPHLHDTTRSPA